MSCIGNKVIVVFVGVIVDIKEGNFLIVKGLKG